MVLLHSGLQMHAGRDCGPGGDSESQEVSLGRLGVDSQKGASLRGTGQQAPRNLQGEMF